MEEGGDVRQSDLGLGDSKTTNEERTLTPEEVSAMEQGLRKRLSL